MYFRQITHTNWDTIDNFVIRIKVARTYDYGNLYNNIIGNQVIDESRSNPTLDLEKVFCIQQGLQRQLKSKLTT